METQLHDDASYAHMLFKKLQPTATIKISAVVPILQLPQVLSIYIKYIKLSEQKCYIVLHQYTPIISYFWGNLHLTSLQFWLESVVTPFLQE